MSLNQLVGGAAMGESATIRPRPIMTGDGPVETVEAAYIDDQAVTTSLTYQAGDRCPACGGKSWFIRNVTAQCAFCECALPIATGSAL